MKKSFKIIIFIAIVILLCYVFAFALDYNRCSNMKLPIFAIKVNDNTYYGLGYRVETESKDKDLTKVEMYVLSKFITGSITDYTNDENVKKDFGRVIMVNDKLYYDTGMESNIIHTCGTMDGYIISNVDSSILPTKNNEANFKGNYGYQYGNKDEIEVKIDEKWYVFKLKEDTKVVPTLDDKISDNTIWCGTFQLIWNDLKNDLAKQDIKFAEELEVVDNLNKETFTTKDISEKYYYKKIGSPSLKLKAEIEQEIKKRFNEKSDILDEFEWEGRDVKDYFLYVMLKKEFKFNKAFDELENGRFGIYNDVKYFGIKPSSSDKLREQVNVMYYNSKDDFAIKLKTNGDDEIILCKSPNGNTFNKIYENILSREDNYKGKKYFTKDDILKVPNIKLKEKKEFTEIENKSFLFSNGDEYKIEKALQVIEFELDRKGGKIKSEAGMMVKNESASLEYEKREFCIDDTFAIFLIEKGKNKPYFAGKISDIKDFQ